MYTDEWTSTDLAGYDGPRIPDTWNYPIFRGRRRHRRGVHGRPDRPTGRDRRRHLRRRGRAARSRARRRWRILADLVRAGARLPHARSALRPVRLPRVRGAHRPAARRDAVGARSGACSWRWSRARGSPARRSVPTAPTSACAARRLGSPQHTREVLAERCGLSDDELTQLEADGVIHTSGDVDTARPDWK